MWTHLFFWLNHFMVGRTNSWSIYSQRKFQAACCIVYLLRNGTGECEQPLCGSLKIFPIARNTSKFFIFGCGKGKEHFSLQLRSKVLGIFLVILVNLTTPPLPPQTVLNFEESGRRWVLNTPRSVHVYKIHKGIKQLRISFAFIFLLFPCVSYRGPHSW